VNKSIELNGLTYIYMTFLFENLEICDSAICG
jgi:hypothetical protein